MALPSGNRRETDDWDPTVFASGSRMAAAMSVALERTPALAAASLLFRVLELSANVLLLACLAWLVRFLVIVFLFVSLWYIPAARHVESYKMPLVFPVLCFVVDDFSMLGLHPKPRSAVSMYRIMVFRVVVLLLFWFFIAGPGRHEAIAKQLPWLMWCLFDRGIMKKFTDNSSSTEQTEFRIDLINLWRALGLSVVVLSLLWLSIAIHMLLVGHFAGRPSPLRAEVSADMTRVMHLTALVDETRDLGDGECRDALLRLKQQNYPRFVLMNIASTFGPIAGFVSRFAAEVYSVVIFAVSMVYYAYMKYWLPAIAQGILGSLLACTVLITIYNIALRAPMQILVEAKRSWDRGIATEPYLDIIRADKGAQALPALFIKIIGLPFAVSTPLQLVVSWGSILGVVGVVALFVFQRFDLGIENEGFSAVQDGRLWTGQTGHHPATGQATTSNQGQVVELSGNSIDLNNADAPAETNNGST
mmetsp:Transcript_14690/g.28965  ORF Transcript_14690/g.28965 Transcript_14690/m.28965 type:complete len:475 (-) Transcript_14690:76-1500(-)